MLNVVFTMIQMSDHKCSDQLNRKSHNKKNEKMLDTSKVKKKKKKSLKSTFNGLSRLASKNLTSKNKITGK